MLRLFLRKKVQSGKGGDEKKKPARTSRHRNRRLFSRYNVTQQHLTIMNEQDILVVREISTQGLSSDVSDRAFHRFNLGDVYEARIRYLGEIIDLRIRVAWKREKVVGFEFSNPDRQTLVFLRRLLRPVELASSLKEVKTEFLENEKGHKHWFHGDGNTDLFVWKTTTGDLEAWQLVTNRDFVEWNSSGGLATGVTRDSGQNTTGDTLTRTEPVLVRDELPDMDRIQFATDIIMALVWKDKDLLLETLMRQSHDT